ncbi:FxDxF family PEP-CTERM protein [Silvimonas sp.]|uniref:FxDxF family PEP-CTERM protein n=1 Tax=Silvimonas sp. TaxID=2650811 RepID=UPI002841A397|nr:FxDxF family PEP-CTERM protein [Silvimonas sp.]MDR3427046.1 FxDxF family PEP-CTERM protein [Silvimonas sp.]
MKLRNLVAGLAFIGASAGAFAIPTSTYTDNHDIGVVSSPRNFIIDNTVTTSSFDDYITFGVDPTSYASNVFFSQLTLGNLQNIAAATLSLWDVTSGPNVFLGSVPLDEPPFTSTATFFSGHTYALEVTGTLVPGAVQGIYGILGTLSPVPEPETYALMGLGVVALVAARARRRKLGDTSFNSVSATAA